MQGGAQHDRPAVVLVGFEDLRGVHAARTFARHGIDVVGVARKRSSYATRSRFVSEVIVAETRTAAFVEALERRGPGFHRPPLIVPCTDSAALQVSRHRERLEPFYLHALPKCEVVETLMDKAAMYRFAGVHGLPIPRTRLVDQDCDLDAAVGDLRFPLAVKPPNSKSPEWLEVTNTKAFKTHTLDELHGIVDRYARPTLIAQEWIEGPETELYACHGYFDAESRPLATFTSRKIRQYPVETGQGCLAEEVRNDRVRDITLDFFRSIGFRGLGYLEVKRDVGTDEYLIVEPNIGRVSGRMAIAEAGGVELLYTMYCDATGQALPDARMQRYTNTKWIFLRQDLQSAASYAMRGQLSPGQWRQSVRGPKSYALWSWRDPGPFIGDLAHSTRLLFSASERGRRSA